MSIVRDGFMETDSEDNEHVVPKLEVAQDILNNVGRCGHVPMWLDPTNTKWKCVTAMREQGGDWRWFWMMEHPKTGQRAILSTKQLHNFY